MKRVIYIHDNVKALRKKYSETQESFAKKVGIGKSTVRNIEMGEYTPNTITLINISLAFKVSLDELVFKKIK